MVFQDRVIQNVFPNNENINFFSESLQINVERNITKKNCYKRKNKVFTKAVVQRCSVKKGFLEISQNSQKNIFARVSFFQLCEISKSTFFDRAPLVVASGFYKVAIIFFTLWSNSDSNSAFKTNAVIVIPLMAPP